MCCLYEKIYKIIIESINRKEDTLNFEKHECCNQAIWTEPFELFTALNLSFGCKKRSNKRMMRKYRKAGDERITGEG